jgi:hypothetical protein
MLAIRGTATNQVRGVALSKEFRAKNSPDAVLRGVKCHAV